jgi:hypothetical protein
MNVLSMIARVWISASGEDRAMGPATGVVSFFPGKAIFFRNLFQIVC